MEEIVNKLIEEKKTISTMESCTGGGLASAITNISGSSEIFKFGAVTYSNEYKIKMGVDSNIIEKYSVYSSEVAREMSKKISEFTKSNYGVGITGKLNRVDKNNPFGKDNVVFISIYDKDNNKYYDYSIEVKEKSRKENKKVVISLIEKSLLNILSENN